MLLGWTRTVTSSPALRAGGNRWRRDTLPPGPPHTGVLKPLGCGQDVALHWSALCSPWPCCCWLGSVGISGAHAAAPTSSRALLSLRAGLGDPHLGGRGGRWRSGVMARAPPSLGLGLGGQCGAPAAASPSLSQGPSRWGHPLPHPPRLCGRPASPASRRECPPQRGCACQAVNGPFRPPHSPSDSR